MASRKKHTKKDYLLCLAIAAAIVIGAVAVIPMVRATRLSHGYQQFKEAFTDSAHLSRRRGGAEVIIDGETRYVESSKISLVYAVLLDTGMGKPQKTVPSGDPITINYADGASISFWEVPIPEASAERDLGLFVRYEGSDGYVYQYDTDKLTLETIRGYLD